MTACLQRSRRYCLLDGEEFEVKYRGGWILWSLRPHPGSTKSHKSGYERPLTTSDALECYRVKHDGSYRGVNVQVEPVPNGSLMLVSSDGRARDLGFEPFERNEWATWVQPGDPQLRVTTTKTPVDAPWRSGGRN